MLETGFSLRQKSHQRQDGDVGVLFGNTVLHHNLTDLPSAQEASAERQSLKWQCIKFKLLWPEADTRLRHQLIIRSDSISELFKKKSTVWEWKHVAVYVNPSGVTVARILANGQKHWVLAIFLSKYSLIKHVYFYQKQKCFFYWSILKLRVVSSHSECQQGVNGSLKSLNALKALISIKMS